MIKKILIVVSFSLILSGCVDGDRDSTTPPEHETEKAVKNTSIPGNEDELKEEEAIQVDLNPLQGKVWSNIEESYYLYFNKISESTIEFQILSLEGYGMQEQTITMDVANITANSVEGEIEKSTSDTEGSSEGLEHNKARLTRIDDTYQISIENLLDFNLLKTSLNLDDWENAKNTVRELTESEALNLIYQAETNATKMFADAFTENSEGYSFNQPFENIISDLKRNYTKAYQLNSLKYVYENPITMLESLYAFPLTEVPKDNFHIEGSADTIKIYYEADMYGYPALYLYTLVIEDGLWKIHSRDSLLSPVEAENAAKTLSDSSDDPEILSRSIESHDFHDYIETILTGSRYHIELYDEYEGVPQIYGLYQVDPFTGMVYLYDRVLDKVYELGKAFE